MGRTERDRLFQILSLHLNNIHETFQLFDQAPVSSSIAKANWDEVVKMGDGVSRQATIFGMLWVERTPKASELQENMEVYFNTLQGFILLSHGSTVGAGPTLSSCVYAAVKRVVDSSFHLWKESVSSYGTDEKQSIPQLVGTVWEACSALQKTPGNNITAIGRAISQVAVTMKDVLREMKELKPGSTDPKDDNGNDDDDDDDDLCEGDLGNDLSPEEMKVAQLTIAAVSATLVVIKEIIRSITSLLKIGNTNDNTTVVDSLENLLKQIQKIGEQIDEMGACLYPPQEVPVIKTAAEKISGIVDDMQKEVENLKGTSEGFLQACYGLKVSLAELKSELDSSSPLDIESKLQKVDLNN
ncbi:uncharacterized protein LOC115712479 [Cannabis sativa]|uniref:uncharacterized protein LOC115712479 n=1 Tax=Cannabis sativa TaxID=3483 RepID=UPI0029CA162D|nr:uncharacterized protein LOC115712479 [Cannabis sativa]